MEKKIAGLLGAVAELSTLTSAQAAHTLRKTGGRPVVRCCRLPAKDVAPPPLPAASGM